MIRVLPRALVLLRRIADALDRAHPAPPRRVRRPLEMSVSTNEDFERGYSASRSPFDDSEEPAP